MHLQIDLKLPVLLATNKDSYRKPETDMWTFFVENGNGGTQPGEMLLLLVTVETTRFRPKTGTFPSALLLSICWGVSHGQCCVSVLSCPSHTLDSVQTRAGASSLGTQPGA